MQKENEVFTNCVRAQLTTSVSKPCTYFATYQNKPVFVKGPYESRADASIPIVVNELKRLMFPDLGLIEYEVLELEVDVNQISVKTNVEVKKGKKRVVEEKMTCVGFVGFQGGARQKWINGTMRDKPGYFQVSRNVFGDAPIPRTMRSSPVMWPYPIEVVDWSKFAEGDIKLAWHDNEYENSVYAKLSNKTVKQLLTHAMLSYVLGLGRDWAPTNFIIDVNREIVYQVDVEMVGSYKPGDSWEKVTWFLKGSRQNHFHTFMDMGTNYVDLKTVFTDVSTRMHKEIPIGDVLIKYPECLAPEREMHVRLDIIDKIYKLFI